MSPSRPGVRAPAPTGASCLSRVPLPPRRARTRHDRSEMPVVCPAPAPACAHQPRPGEAACHASPTRPGVRTPSTAGACGRSRVPPPAPACTNKPRPGRVACHVSPSDPGLRAPARTGARCLSRVALPPQRARTSHDRSELPVTSPPPALASAHRPRPRRAACHVSSSRPGVRAPAPTGASCLSRVLLPPRRARTSPDRGVLPVTCPPPAPACANQPRPRQDACHVPPSRPGVRAPATTGASCLSRVPDPPRRVHTVHSLGVRLVKSTPSRLGVREPATTGASCLSRVPLPPRRAGTSHNQGEVPVTCPPPAPVCADRPQPGRAAGQVSPLPPQRARTSHDRGVPTAN